MKLGIALPSSHQGVYLPSPFAGAAQLIAIAQMAERFGLDSAWVLDFMTPSYERHKQPSQLPEWYEAMMSLSFLGAVTEEIKLGTAVVQLPLRDPFLLARQAATLDALSGGRCLLGVGLGQARSEFKGMRPRDASMHRGELFEEELTVLNKFFNESEVSYQGTHYQCHDLRLTPRPVQTPFPIYLSGTTERTARRVAKWASGWFLSRAQSRRVKESIEALSVELDQVGRDRCEVELVVTKGLTLGKTQERALEQFHASMLPGRMDELAIEYGVEGQPSKNQIFNQNLIGTPEQVAEQLDQVRRCGVDHCVIMYFAVSDAKEFLEQLQWLGEEVLPLLAWRSVDTESSRR